jgi:hypothetical protein
MEEGIVLDGVGNRIANENLAFADFVGTKFNLVKAAIDAIFFINNFDGTVVVRRCFRSNPLATDEVFHGYVI